MTAVEAMPAGFDVVGGARYIGLGRSTLYEQIRLGRIRIVKVGRRTIIPRTELDAFLERQLSDGDAA